jgi:hypothetical protein
MQRDPRYDRMLLALQFAARKAGYPVRLCGEWGKELHVLIQLPPSSSSSSSSSCGAAAESNSRKSHEAREEEKKGEENGGAQSSPSSSSPVITFLEDTLRTCFTRAGFSSWSLTAGCEDGEVPVQLELFADFVPFGTADTSSATTAFAQGSGNGHGGGEEENGGGRGGQEPLDAQAKKKSLMQLVLPPWSAPGRAGVVRIFPRSIGTFEDICAAIDSKFSSTLENEGDEDDDEDEDSLSRSAKGVPVAQLPTATKKISSWQKRLDRYAAEKKAAETPSTRPM